MQILSLLFILVMVCSVIDFYDRFWDHIVGFLLMDTVSCFNFVGHKSDFGCGFLLLGCFRQLFNMLCLFFMFNLGLKVLQVGYHLKGIIRSLFDFKRKLSDLRSGFCSKSCIDGKCSTRVSCGFRRKSTDLRNGFCSKSYFYDKCNTRASPGVLLEFCKNPEPMGEMEENDEIEKRNRASVKENLVPNGGFGETATGNGNVEESFDSEGEEFGDDINEQEFFGDDGDDDDDDDDELNVMALRKLVKIERERTSAVYLELEKERIAAATAAEEAMAMIWRLQNEKSLIEMEAKQYRRLAEEKQIHDQEVIQSLRWLVMKHELERSLLEDQLRFIRRKTKVLVKGDEGDESEGFDQSLCFFNSNIEESPGDALISSLDIDMSRLWNAAHVR